MPGKVTGVVLFHDSYEYQENFGVHQLIAELRQDYAIFEMYHSHGLAVLALNGSDFIQDLGTSRITECTYLEKIKQLELQLAETRIHVRKSFTQRLRRLIGRRTLGQR